MDVVNEYTELINEYPNFFEYYEFRSEAYSSINQHEEALADAKMAVQLQPGDAAMHKLLADAHMAVGKSSFAKAVEAFKRGRAIDPSDQSMKSALANALAYLCSPFGDAFLEDNAWSKLKQNPRTSEWLDILRFHTRMEKIISKFQDDRSPIEAIINMRLDDDELIEAVAFLLSDHMEDYEMHVPPGMDHEAAQFPRELGNRELGKGNRALQAKVESNLKKEEGDDALSSDNFQAAVNLYTEAIDLAPDYHPVLFSKRSAAHASLEHYEDAVSDAQRTVQLKPFWPEGYSRLGAAHHGLGVQHFQDAWEVYNTGAVLGDDVKLLWGMSRLENYTDNPLKEAFKPSCTYILKPSESDMFRKLSNSSRTSGFMEQDDFISMMREVKKNPRLLNLYLKDDRMIKALCVLFHSPEY